MRLFFIIKTLHYNAYHAFGFVQTHKKNMAYINMSGHISKCYATAKIAAASNSYIRPMVTTAHALIRRQIDDQWNKPINSA